ncbi:hypothetical protein ACQJBY_036131 [Aegilops geniculata]
MAAAVHFHLHHHYLLRPCPPPRRACLFSSPWLPLPPARLRSSFPAPTSHLAVAGADESEFVVVTFYKLVPVDDPRAEVAAHLHFLQGRDMDIHGRIYMNQQGINAQYSTVVRAKMQWPTRTGSGQTLASLIYSSRFRQR